jgi:hypothetical protein
VNEVVIAASFDSMVLIYAGAAPSKHAVRSPDFNQLRTRALILLHDISEKQTPCILSAIVLSELLVHVPANQKLQFTNEFSATYVIATFHKEAASLCSDIWATYLAETSKSRGGLPKADRVVARADCMIVASACAAGAIDFFSHDDNCRKFAKLAGMQVHDLPDISKSMMDTWMASDIDAGIDVAAPTKAMKGPKGKKANKGKRKKRKQ